MLSRSFGYALVVGALAIGGTTACGTSPTTSDDEAPANGDPWSVSGSSATQSALGITSWGFREISADTVSVAGYDADNQRVVEVRQKMTAVDAYHWTMQLGVARAGAPTAFLQYALGARAVEEGTEVSGQVGNDSLSKDAVARHILERLGADIALPGGSGTTVPTASLQPMTLGATSTLRPMDAQLANGDPSLTQGGDKLIDEDGDGKDDRCEQPQQQASQQCGGDMGQSIAPILQALGQAGSAGPQAFTSILQFIGIYQCMDENKKELPPGVKPQPIALFDMAETLKTSVNCAVKQQQQQGGQGGQNGQSGSPLEGLMSGVQMLTGMTQAMSSMQSMGQNCPQQQQPANCPQK